MAGDILIRTLIAVMIVGFGITAYTIGNRWILIRNRRNRRGLEALRPGIPAVLYFTTPTCMPCRTRQRPALGQLQARLGDGVQIVQIDASAQPELADFWGVLSVPTTFIIDSRRRPRRVNHGVQSAEDLEKQIRAAEAHPGLLFSRQGAIK